MSGCIYLWVDGCVYLRSFSKLFRLLGKSVCLGVGLFVFVGEWVGGCMCDHLVGISGYSVRQCVRELVGLGVCNFVVKCMWVGVCVSLCLEGWLVCACRWMGGCLYMCMCVFVCMCVWGNMSVGLSVCKYVSVGGNL